MTKKTVLVFDSRERFIWLDGMISPEVARRFKYILDMLNRKFAPITLYIKGLGGDPYSAFCMMSDMNKSTSPISVVAHEYVGSGCFTITQAGDYRLAMKGTLFSFHPAVLIVHPKKESFEMTQEELIGTLESLRFKDAVQLTWFFKKGRPKNYLPDECVNKISSLYLKWKEEEGISKVIEKEEVVKNDYNLSPSRYVAQNGEDETLPLDEAVVLVKEAEEEMAKADEKLRNVLEQLGFESNK